MDLGLRTPRGLDTSLILPSRRRRGEGSPELGPDGKPLPHTRSGKAGAADVNVALAVATDPSGFEEVKRKGMILWEKLTTVGDHHYDPPRMLHTEFLRLPPRAEFPDYYNLIKKPVAFNEIWTKLDRLEYSSIVEVRNDFNQCFVNAKRYNAPGSGIFLDAKKLHKVLKQWYAHITGEAEAPEDDDAPAPMPQPVYQQQQQQSPLLPAPLPLYGGTPLNTSNAEAGPSTSLALPASIPGTNFAKRGPTLKPWLTRKLAETTALVDASGRKYAESFKSLPDKKEWAEYYRSIPHPMAFDTVANKVIKRTYTSVQGFIDDVNLIFTNAQWFNEESSPIWQDAHLLQLHFNEVMKEVPPVFIPPRKYNTAKRRAEAEALARGEVLPPSTSSKKRQRVAAGESEPPEEGMSQGEGDSGDDYEGEGSVPPAGRTPSVPPPAVLDPFGLPLMVPKVEEMVVADPFAIPGSATAADGRSPSATPGGVDLPPLPPLPTLPTLPHQASPAPVSPYPPQQQQGYDLAPPALPMAFSAPSPLGLNGAMPSPPAGNGVASTLDIGKPRLLARVKVNGREPAISRILIHTTPPSAPLTLHTSPTSLQHSFSLPPSVTRVDFTPFLSPSSASRLSIKPSVRPLGVMLEPLAELPSAEGGSSNRWALTPKVGLNVVEFMVQGEGQEEEGEVYRCFVMKC